VTENERSKDSSITWLSSSNAMEFCLGVWAKVITVVLPVFNSVSFFVSIVPWVSFVVTRGCGFVAYTVSRIFHIGWGGGAMGQFQV
jgi:hypothetical protein